MPKEQPYTSQVSGPPQCPNHLSPLVWAFLAWQKINEQEVQICTGVSSSQTVPDGDKTGCTRPLRQSAKIQSTTCISDAHVIVLKGLLKLQELLSPFCTMSFPKAVDLMLFISTIIKK